MKLLVILLSLLSERYLVHAVSSLRFNWFSDYYHKITKVFLESRLALHPVFILILILAPLVVISGLVLFIVEHLLIGFICFLLNLAIFYYCLGPENPFYPINENTNEMDPEIEAGRYFSRVNGELFSIVFWYVVAGALGAIVYRLVSLCSKQEFTKSIARQLTNLLDWIPARITLLLYLLVGNFQKGIHFFIQNFISAPEKNDLLLREGGLMAARTTENEPVKLPYAENLVEHATIVYLVFLAFFTLIALM